MELPDNFTENDVIFDENADKTFVSLVNDFIQPLGGKVFIKKEKSKKGYELFFNTKQKRKGM